MGLKLNLVSWRYGVCDCIIVLVYNVMMMYIIYSSNGQLVTQMIYHVRFFFVGFSIRGVVAETGLILTHIIL
jgi:hypothetical protein